MEYPPPLPQFELLLRYLFQDRCKVPDRAAGVVYFTYCSSIALAREYSESLDCVGAKHYGEQSIVKGQSVDTAMLRPFSLPRVTKERYVAGHGISRDHFC